MLDWRAANATTSADCVSRLVIGSGAWHKHLYKPGPPAVARQRVRQVHFRLGARFISCTE
jgi:hypothetical protein